MKVLLVYTNTNRNLAPPPVGLSYIVPPLRRKGHEVRLLDLMLSRDPVADMGATLRELAPDVVGLSVRNLDNQFMMDLKAPLPEIRGYVGMAKTRGITTVLGGTGETPETVRESIAFLPRVHSAFFSYAIGLRVSPHATLFEAARKEGLVANAAELLHSKFYVSKEIDVAQTKRLIDRSVRRFAYRSSKMLPIILGNLLARLGRAGTAA